MANGYSGRKYSGWWNVIKTILILAAIVFVAYKVYDKYFRKKVKQDILADNDAAGPMIPAEND